MNRDQRPTLTAENLTRELQLSFQPRLRRRDLRVSRTQDITPRYRRIFVTSDELDDYPFVPFCPADHVKVYFPDPASGEIVAYRSVGDPADDDWEIDVPGATPIRRDYTPRSWDPQTRELALDFVLHDHGIAGVWAARAQPGDPVVVVGPRANWLLPVTYEHYLAIGDETALPAIARMIEEAPAGARVTAFIEVADAAEEQPLVAAPGVEAQVHWIHRDTAPVDAGHASAVETAVRGWSVPADLDTLYVFAAGESGAMKPIRRYLRRELGMPKPQVHVDGYWRRGEGDHDHHVSDEED